jgi:hypothetical protein
MEFTRNTANALSNIITKMAIERTWNTRFFIFTLSPFSYVLEKQGTSQHLKRTRLSKTLLQYVGFAFLKITVTKF